MHFSRDVFRFPQLAGLWRNADFKKLWTAQAISVFGSTISREALPLVAIIALSATPSQIGLLGALGMLPALLLGLPAGVWVDRLRRRPLLIAADFGRAVILVSVPIAALLGVLSLIQLYVVVILAGTLTLFFNVADNSFLPAIVKRENLIEANSKLGVTESLGEIAAPTVAGTLVQLITAPFTILVDSLSYLVSAFFLGQIRSPEPAPKATSGGKSAATFWQEILAGLRLIGHNPILRPLAGCAGVAAFFGGFFGALYALYALRVLGLSPATLGMLISAGGIGALLGALLASRLPRRFGPGPALAGSFFMMGLTVLLIPLAASLPWPVVILLIGQVVGDSALTVYFINAVSLRQSVTPDHMLGRMNASFTFLGTGIAPLGFLCGGWLGERLGIQITLFLAAAGTLAGGIWLAFSPVLKLKAHLTLQQEEDAPE